MMREIKFRAWDQEQKFMQPDVHITYNPGGHYGIESFDGFLGDPKYVVMQYTGQKDKNGQQAYQDDLIRPWDDDRIYQIIWDDDYARFDCKQVSGHKWPCEMLLVRTSEIIGNTHENPELIKK